MAEKANRRKKGCISPVSFTVLLGATIFIYIGSIGPYTTGILTTLQREFLLKSSEVALLFSVNDIVGIVAITPVAYLGNLGHRPRIIGVLTLVFAVGCLLCALPQFTDPSGLDLGMIPQSNDTSDNNTSATPTEQGLCAGLGDALNSSKGDTCSKEELAAAGAQFGRAAWLVVGQILIGLGSSGFFTLGITYMDDGIPSKSDTALYVALLFMVVSISPVSAFAISGYSLSLHRDFYKIDVNELGYDDKDPRWIGAWWLGYVFYAVLIGLISIPYFCFPREWSEIETYVEVDDKDSNINEKSTPSDLPKDEPNAAPTDFFISSPSLPPVGTSPLDYIKGYFCTLQRLFINMTYMSVVMGSIADSAMFAGCFSFLGRYLQTQYDVTPAMTSIMLGCSTTPSSFFGNLGTGFVLRRLKPSMKGLSRTVLVISGLTIAVSAMFFFVGCETSPIAGINVPYGGSTPLGENEQVDDFPPCLSECECVDGIYNPVCGADGITYVTPCHAGCTGYMKYANDDDYDGGHNADSNQVQYTSCSCIAAGTNTSSHRSGSHDDTRGVAGSAVPEKCASACSSRKYGFLVLLGLLMLLFACNNIPGFMLFMRCVELDDRSVGIGLSSLLGRVLAYIPSPIFFGAAIQTTCLMFQEACGKTGNCLIYDNLSLTYVLFGLVLCMKIIASVMYLITYLSLRKDEDGEYHSSILCVKPSGAEASEVALEPLKDGAC